MRFPFDSSPDVRQTPPVIFRLFAIIPIFLSVLFLSGCRDKEKEARRAQLIDIMHGNTGDPDLKAASEKARATIGEFLSALQKPAPGQGQFLVRKAYPAANGKQQIVWINQLTYDGTLLHGKVDDNTIQPGSGIGNKEGRVSFPPTEIADWMFNDNGQAAGGWMLRVFKKKFPEEWEKGRFSEQIKAFKE